METIWSVCVYIIAAMLLELFCLYSWYKISNRKIDLHDYNNYIALFILTVAGTIINFFVPQFLKIFLIVLIMLIVNYYLILQSMPKSVITVLISQFITMLSELLLVLVISGILNINMQSFMTNIYSPLLLNILVILCSLLILKTPIPCKIYNYLLSTFNNVKNNNLVIYFLIILMLASVFMIMSYMKLPAPLLLICNTLLTILYVIVIVKMANAKENFNRVNSKYENSLTSLKEYEDIMDKYKIANHENKNQLLTIRNMIKAKDKTTVDYIENLVEDKIKDNEEIFYKTSKIPEGGLRATIYSKLCKMDEFKIDYSLEIANDVRAVDLITIGEDVTLDACKVIGVFLDNAIEEVNKLETKKIYISLFIMDNELCIDISNNFEGEVDVDKIDTARYTTKGDGHGYGLSLVKKIVKNNKLLGNERRVDNNIFTQRLKIKM